MDRVTDDSRLDTSLLKDHGFDPEWFEATRARIISGELSPEAAIVTEAIEAVNDTVAAVFDGEEGKRLRHLGQAALEAGQVASVVLNGGMATRFGGVVKGVVEVYDGETFLSLKAADIRRASEQYKASVPLVLMNSFATHEATMAHVEDKKHFGMDPKDILHFKQSVSIRLNPDASLFVGDDGRPSYHAPGHGDFFASIRRSGVLAQLLERGVRYILFSNVDNLGATVDPVVLGHHIDSGRPMTAEVTQKQRTASGAWDKGGAPALVAGKKQLVEGFRFPPGFAQETLPDFSTNNMVFNAEALNQEVPLAKHVVTKKVDGRPAIQLESITCEASGVYDGDTPLFPLTLLRVPREGHYGRFFPVKEPVDLEASREILRARLERGWRLRESGSLA